MAMSAVNDLPQRARWLSASARIAVGRTGNAMASILLEHYRDTLNRIHQDGYMNYAVKQFRPYLYAAVSQFAPRQKSLTERILSRRK